MFINWSCTDFDLSEVILPTYTDQTGLDTLFLAAISRLV
jgi:hypothetical protein